MAPAEDLAAFKRRLSPLLLDLAGVAGVGLSATGLRIYLERDDLAVRAAAASLMTSHASGQPYEMVVSGKIVAQSRGAAGR